MKKSSIRLLFALMTFIFSVELLLALNLTEPFPAIIYPSFADIPSFNSTIQKPSIIVFFHNSDSLEIDKADLFHNLSNVYSNVILSENFNEKNSFLTSLKEVRTVSTNVGSKEFNLTLNEVWDEAQVQEGKTWITHTLRNSLKRDDFTRIEVQWHNYQLSQDETEPLKRGELVEKFVVNLKN